ncbi:MAG: hypothetical protein Sapg2KO_07500 [Saprospiraceae bacterium]
MKIKFYLLVSIGLLCSLGLTAQKAGFYVNQKYAQHLESNRTTGRAEVAFFALQIEQKDSSCLKLKEFKSIDSTRLIYANRFSEEQYCWQPSLGKYIAPCKRPKSEGLFRHQHTEGENWLVFQVDDQSLLLKRCGWARAKNQFIQADSSRFFRK